MKFPSLLQVVQRVRVGHRGAERPHHSPPPTDPAPLGLDLLEDAAGTAIQEGLGHRARVTANLCVTTWTTEETISQKQM